MNGVGITYVVLIKNFLPGSLNISFNLFTNHAGLKIVNACVQDAHDWFYKSANVSVVQDHPLFYLIHFSFVQSHG